jgi:hypothetical protein
MQDVRNHTFKQLYTLSNAENYNINDLYDDLYTVERTNVGDDNTVAENLRTEIRQAHAHLNALIAECQRRCRTWPVIDLLRACQREMRGYQEHSYIINHIHSERLPRPPINYRNNVVKLLDMQRTCHDVLQFMDEIRPLEEEEDLLETVELHFILIHEILAEIEIFIEEHRRIAVTMSMHRRLGDRSLMHSLDSHLLETIYKDT